MPGLELARVGGMTRSILMAAALAMASAGCSLPQESTAPQPQEGLITVSGKVIERSRVWTPEGTPRDTMRLRPPDGRVVLVQLGVPGGEGTIGEGDRVTVTGAPMRVGSDSVLFAHYVLQDTTPQR